MLAPIYTTPARGGGASYNTHGAPAEDSGARHEAYTVPAAGGCTMVYTMSVTQQVIHLSLQLQLTKHHTLPLPILPFPSCTVALTKHHHTLPLPSYHSNHVCCTILVTDVNMSHSPPTGQPSYPLPCLLIHIIPVFSSFCFSSPPSFPRPSQCVFLPRLFSLPLSIP